MFHGLSLVAGLYARVKGLMGRALGASGRGEGEGGAQRPAEAPLGRFTGTEAPWGSRRALRGLGGHFSGVGRWERGVAGGAVGRARARERLFLGGRAARGLPVEQQGC